MAEAEKKALVAQLALQRSGMLSQRDDLTRELSISYQVKRSLRKNSKTMVVGGAVAGIALGFLFRRRKVIYSPGPVKRGMIGSAAHALFSLARPALTTLALAYAKDYAEAHFGPFENNSMLGGSPQK
ncbi:MAG: D-alanyl-D-alanine carboxypeptidase [Paracoccaceae bacterium]|jgi:hypothetical protein